MSGIGRTNSGSGGGSLSPNNAVIYVFAKTGSTITFSKNGVVVKELDASKGIVSAKNASISEWYYSIGQANYGDWLVTATSTDLTTSKAVTVSSNVVYDVELYYLYLYNAGTYNVEWQTTNKRYASNTAGAKYPTISNYDNRFGFSVSNGAGTYQIKDTVDVTQYKTLWFEVLTSGNLNIGIYLGTETYWGSATMIANTDVGMKSIDITSFTGNYKPFCAGSSASGTAYGQVRRVWLEP